MIKIFGTVFLAIALAITGFVGVAEAQGTTPSPVSFPCTLTSSQTSCSAYPLVNFSSCTFSSAGTWSGQVDFRVQGEQGAAQPQNFYPSNATAPITTTTSNGVYTASPGGAAMLTAVVDNPGGWTGTLTGVWRCGTQVALSALAGGGGGTVTSVGASAPLNSSGGSAPQLTCKNCQSTFNVLTYGALCDGTTDDTAAFASAVAAADPVNGIIQFPPGTCVGLISDTSTAAVTFEGGGGGIASGGNAGGSNKFPTTVKGTTVLKCPSGSTGSTLMNLAPSGSTVSGGKTVKALYLDGNAATCAIGLRWAAQIGWTQTDVIGKDFSTAVFDYAGLVQPNVPMATLEGTVIHWGCNQTTNASDGVCAKFEGAYDAGTSTGADANNINFFGGYCAVKYAECIQVNRADAITFTGLHQVAASGATNTYGITNKCGAQDITYRDFLNDQNSFVAGTGAGGCTNGADPSTQRASNISYENYMQHDGQQQNVVIDTGAGSVQIKDDQQNQLWANPTVGGNAGFLAWCNEATGSPSPNDNCPVISEDIAHNALILGAKGTAGSQASAIEFSPNGWGNTVPGSPSTFQSSIRTSDGAFLVNTAHPNVYGTALELGAIAANTVTSDSTSGIPFIFNNTGLSGNSTLVEFQNGGVDWMDFGLSQITFPGTNVGAFVSGTTSGAAFRFNNTGASSSLLAAQTNGTTEFSVNSGGNTSLCDGTSNTCALTFSNTHGSQLNSAATSQTAFTFNNTGNSTNKNFEFQKGGTDTFSSDGSGNVVAAGTIKGAALSNSTTTQSFAPINYTNTGAAVASTWHGSHFSCTFVAATSCALGAGYWTNAAVFSSGSAIQACNVQTNATDAVQFVVHQNTSSSATIYASAPNSDTITGICWGT